MNELTNFDKIRQQIDVVRDIKEMISMSNDLEAIRTWAKQTKQSLETQNQIAEYRLRVERKKGEWLSKNVKPGNPQLSTDSTIGLKDIGISRDESSKAQMINKLNDEEFESYIEDTKETNKEVTLNEAVRLAKQIIRNEKIEEQIEELEKAPPNQPTDKYDVIVIDPPWEYGHVKNYDPKTPYGRVANPYPEMSQADLLKIKLPAKDDCILWLWTTNKFMPNAYELLQEWGFIPKTILTWDKINIGVGRWLRSVTEHCILAVKGSPVWTNKTQSTIIHEKRTEHSVKPEGFYNLVNKICYGKKLDYFARKKRGGWDVFGDEV